MRKVRNTGINGLIFFFALAVFSSRYAAMAQNFKRPYIDTSFYTKFSIKPSATDASIKNCDIPHVVFYDARIRNNKILLWLTGTNGTTNNLPVDYLKTALEQGYRVVALSFISTPGVSQICVGNVLGTDPGCAAEFRRKRVYGDNVFSPVPDEAQDAIIPRFVKLLQYLANADTAGHWLQYLDMQKVKPVWSNITVSGQSQGGGMAEFIAKNELVARVVSFSGGWDYADSQNKKIADWYYNNSVTPMGNWYTTYNVNEMAAASISKICIALKVPVKQVYAFDKPLSNPDSKLPNPYHTDGVHNPAYKPVWIAMLGTGL